MWLSVSLCEATSILSPSGMTYIPLLYVVRQNISDCVDMLVRPSGLVPSIFIAVSTKINLSNGTIVLQASEDVFCV
jgi:hypothetical protein